MTTPSGIVYLLDDEREMVNGLTRLLRATRFEVRGFSTRSDSNDLRTTVPSIHYPTIR